MSKSKRIKQKGFSLVELLIVMSLTTLMLTIIFAPFTQSVRMLLTGQGEVGLQSEVKNVLTLISKDISKAVQIRKTKGLITFTVPENLESNKNQQRTFSGCYLDLWLPEQISQQGPPKNSKNNKIDPTLKNQETNEILPIQQGTRFVRYFISLKDPKQPYNIKKGNLLVKANQKEDNPFVVYRAEIDSKDWNDYFPKQEDLNNQDFVKEKWESLKKVSKIIHRVNQFDVLEISTKKDPNGNNQFRPLVQFNFTTIPSIETKELYPQELELAGEEQESPDGKFSVLQEYFYPSSLSTQNGQIFTEHRKEILKIENFDAEVLQNMDLTNPLARLRITDNPNERYLCMDLITHSKEHTLFNTEFSNYGKRYWLFNLGDKLIVPGTDRLFWNNKIYTRVTKDPIKPYQYKIRYFDAINIPDNVFTPDALPDEKELLLNTCIRPQFKKGYIEFCSDPLSPLEEGEYTFEAQIISPNTKQTMQLSYLSDQKIRVNFGLSYYVESNMKYPQVFSMQRIVELKNSL